MNSGGLSAYNSMPRCGNSHWPNWTIWRATMAKRGSSEGHGSRKPSPTASSNSAKPKNSHICQRSSRDRGGNRDWSAGVDRFMGCSREVAAKVPRFAFVWLAGAGG